LNSLTGQTIRSELEVIGLKMDIPRRPNGLARDHKFLTTQRRKLASLRNM